MNERKYRFIDLFAGAGGLSEGFVQNGNFEPLAHVEMNKDACNTLRTRACYYYLKENSKLNLYEDYQKGKLSQEELYAHVPQGLIDTVINSEISEESIKGIFSIIDDIVSNEEIEDLDLIIGGPPCQAYSLVGRAVSSDKMESDPRNYLYKQYVEFLQHYNPRMFIFENVPGILTAKKGETFKTILREFDRIGYTVDYKILNASDFGVLQNRRRVIVIGWRKGFDFTYPEFDVSNISMNAVVNDILSDLSPLKRGEEKNEYIYPPNQYLIDSGIRNKQDVLTHHICRKHNKNDLAIYKRIIHAWNKGQSRLKYTDLPEKLKTHKNVTAFLDRYKIMAGDIKCSQTMIAHIAKDGHYFIHPDIKQCRSISVREAARVQSFPDNYYFEGSRSAKFVQIGNAVPPLMAKGLAKKIMTILEETDYEKVF